MGLVGLGFTYLGLVGFLKEGREGKGRDGDGDGIRWFCFLVCAAWTLGWARLALSRYS